MKNKPITNQKSKNDYKNNDIKHSWHEEPTEKKRNPT